ncbi:hypothetical protein [uncultured Bacteroides sp.]|uniref:hypothetical protein n=1 Tax=uncultured Bacteroides sp. TaxID=162156 RepID=UPI002AABD93A|nr:hypothetical protein [uncultured Bacteroides sp.]
MDTFINILSTSVLTGLIASILTVWLTRKNLKTTKYIDTIVNERIKWIQIVRADLTELVSALLIHDKNTEYLSNMINKKEQQDYANYVTSRDSDSYDDEELREYSELERNIENAQIEFKKVLSRSEIVNKAILLKLRFNSDEDSDIIDQLNIVIDNYADYSKKPNDIMIDINELTAKSQQVLKREWDKVKAEVDKK